MPDDTVLLVEDNDDTRAVMRTMLKVYGYAVIEAADGEEAVRLASERLPRLILLDLKIPVMDGLEVTQKIRSLSETQHIPIIILSAYCGDFELRKELIEAGANECLTKPVDVGRLQSMLKAHWN